MTDNAKALADHIRSDLTYITGLADHMEAGGDVSKKNIGDLIAIVRWNAEHHLECRDTIETQAREIERLREALQDSARALDASNVLIHALSGAPSVMVETFAERTRAALAGDSHGQ